MSGSVRGITLLLVVAVIVTGALQLRPRAKSAVARPEKPLAPSASNAPFRAPDSKNQQAQSDMAPLSWNGLLEPVSQATLSVTQPGRITALSVRVGDWVRRGQTLIRLEGDAGRSQVASAQAGLTGAQAQLAKARAGGEAQRLKAGADIASAKEGVSQANVRLRQALISRDAARAGLNAEVAAARDNARKAQIGLSRATETLRGLEALAKVGGVARNDLEGARAQVENARADLNQAETQVRALMAGSPDGAPYRVALAEQETDLAQSGVRQANNGLKAALSARHQLLSLAETEIAAASAGVKQGQAGLIGAQSQADLSRLVSPMDGLVSAVTAHAGETAQPGVPLMTLVSPRALHVTALALARQLPRLYIRQCARVDLDTRPARPLMARIDMISRIAEPDGRSFRITFALINPPSDLRMGQTVRVTLAGK